MGLLVTGDEDLLEPVSEPPVRVYTMEEMDAALRRAAADFGEFLVAKNRSYGGAVFNPERFFSDASPRVGIRVRMDDKLARIRKGTGELATTENNVEDLFGYRLIDDALTILEALP